MSRSQAGQAFTTASNDNASDQQTGEDASKAEVADIGNYSDQLSKFAANNPYVEGGKFETAQNQTLAGDADVGSRALQDQLDVQAKRTGQNATAANATAAENARQAQITEAGEEGQATTQRIAGDQSTQQDVLKGDAGLAGLEQGLYATSLGAADSSLGNETENAKMKSFLETENDAANTEAASFAQGAGEGLCPAMGSLYLMADGSHKLVEQLVVGDRIAGIDGEPQAIEEIQSASAIVLRVETDDGFIARNSRVHAYALPFGGFTVAVRSLGRTIRTRRGSGRVVSVELDGKDMVFNIITDGSHTYCADGIWSLGVGDAERRVSMETWDGIGERLTQEMVGV